MYNWAVKYETDFEIQPSRTNTRNIYYITYKNKEYHDDE